MPRCSTREPEKAACLFESARAGKPASVGGDLDTIMAGLACGEPSPLAWRILGPGADAFMTIPDAAASEAMRNLADLSVVGGESGVAGLITDGVQRHVEADGDARLLSHLPHGAGWHGLPDLDLSFRQRPVVVALAMDDQHLGAPRRVLSGYHSAAGQDWAAQGRYRLVAGRARAH